ncbi:hypothetical protein BST61_g472 [Cercospora zeina]
MWGMPGNWCAFSDSPAITRKGSPATAHQDADFFGAGLQKVCRRLLAERRPRAGNHAHPIPGADGSTANLHLPARQAALAPSGKVMISRSGLGERMTPCASSSPRGGGPRLTAKTVDRLQDRAEGGGPQQAANRKQRKHSSVAREW